MSAWQVTVFSRSYGLIESQGPRIVDHDVESFKDVCNLFSHLNPDAIEGIFMKPIGRDNSHSLTVEQAAEL